MAAEVDPGVSKEKDQDAKVTAPDEQSATDTAKDEAAQESTEVRPKMPVGDGKGHRNLSPYRTIVPGVLNQRPYKELSAIDLSEFDWIPDNVKVELEDKVFKVTGDSKVDTLRVARNLIAVSGGDFETLSSYSTDDEGGWLIRVRRKEN